MEDCDDVQQGLPRAAGPNFTSDFTSYMTLASYIRTAVICVSDSCDEVFFFIDW